MQNLSKHSYALILAGGGGTRLWPKSRKKHPKHFLDLFNQGTLLRITYDRITKIMPPERIFMITNKAHFEKAKKELPELPSENFISEPQAKNTALAMGIGATFIHKKDPQAVIINLAADHIYLDLEKFHQTAVAALDVAEKSANIVTIGIKPTFPHTGLGYIRLDGQIEEIEIDGNNFPVYKCLGFKEKPNLETAEGFIASGEYLWNANIYCWSTKTILEAFSKYSPQMYQLLEDMLLAIGTSNEQKTMSEIYEKGENTQIDIAVSEKADNLVAIPGDFGWSDVGDWKVVYDTIKKDGEGNVVVDKEADFISIDSKNNFIEANGKMVAMIGVSNLVVIETDDALLICDKEKAQDVKKAVEKLKIDKKDKYL